MRNLVRVPVPGSLNNIILKAFPYFALKEVFPEVNQPPSVEIRGVEIRWLVPRYAIVGGCKCSEEENTEKKCRRDMPRLEGLGWQLRTPLLVST